jgi:hypothetical protein
MMEIDGRIVPNFSFKEMANNETSDKVKLKIDTPEAVEHAFMMQELRTWAVATYPEIFTDGLTVSSWYRTKEYNARPSVKGASNSAHLDCRATDINNIPEALYNDFIIAWQVICSNHGKIGGIELYEWGMHFDSHSDKFGCTKFRLKDNRKEK